MSFPLALSQMGFDKIKTMQMRRRCNYADNDCRHVEPLRSSWQPAGEELSTGG